MSEDEARRKARFEFGQIEGVKPDEGVKEDCRNMRRAAWIESTLADIRFALRTLRKSPTFTIVNAVRLPSLPVPRPAELLQADVRQAIEQGSRGAAVLIEGDSASRETAVRVQSLISPEESVFVFLDSEHSAEHVAAELENYARFVTPGSYHAGLLYSGRRQQSARIARLPAGRSQLGPGPSDGGPGFVPGAAAGVCARAHSSALRGARLHGVELFCGKLAAPALRTAR